MTHTADSAETDDPDTTRAKSEGDGATPPSTEWPCRGTFVPLV